jgi:hypothetical protein
MPGAVCTMQEAGLTQGVCDQCSAPATSTTAVGRFGRRAAPRSTQCDGHDRSVEEPVLYGSIHDQRVEASRVAQCGVCNSNTSSPALQLQRTRSRMS